MPITTGSFAKDLWPGVKTWYGLKYKEYPLQYTSCFDITKSSLAFEEEVGATGFGLAQVKPEGSSITYDDMSQGFVTRYTHITYSLGFIVTREMKEDGIAVTKSIARAGSLAFSNRQTKETICANIFNRAFNSSYVGGDGKEMCATDHPNKSGGTWRNELSTAADLSEAALEQAYIDIEDFKNDRGLLISVHPTHLLIPSELRFEADRILESPLRVAVANNDINALKNTGAIGGYMVNNYLTDADAWFLKTDCPDGLRYFERRGDELDLDSDFDTENAKFKSTMRFSVGHTDPRGVFGSPGA